MGIELVIIKLCDKDKDLFLQQNHIILDDISIKRICSEHPHVSNVLSEFTNIENKDDKSIFKVYFCKSDNFMKVAEEINKYCDKLKSNLDEQYELYKKSQVLEFFKENSYDKIKDLLEHRQYDKYKEIMKNCVDIIENDLSDNYDLYEYDSYNDNYYIYNIIKNIAEKLTNYSSQNDIYYYLSY